MHCLLSILKIQTVLCLFHSILLFYNNLVFFFFSLCFNFASRSSNVLSGPMQDPDVQMHGGMDRVPADVERRGCPRLSISELNLVKFAVEPKTGIEFPVILDNLSAGEQNSSFDSEVNVCFTGSSVPFTSCMMSFFTDHALVLSFSYILMLVLRWKSLVLIFFLLKITSYHLFLKNTSYHLKQKQDLNWKF